MKGKSYSFDVTNDNDTNVAGISVDTLEELAEKIKEQLGDEPVPTGSGDSVGPTPTNN